MKTWINIFYYTSNLPCLFSRWSKASILYVWKELVNVRVKGWKQNRVKLFYFNNVKIGEPSFLPLPFIKEWLNRSFSIAFMFNVGQSPASIFSPICIHSNHINQKLYSEPTFPAPSTLLPKPSKDLMFLKNWRPLTLLNCDYKIMAKIVAIRIKKRCY